MRTPSILSRRQLVLLVGSAVRLGAGRDDFWNTKPPSEWDAGEIYRLMNRSPWAHAVQAFITGEEWDNMNPRTHGVTRGGVPPEYGAKGVVTWESAQPIRDAMKTATAPVLENHYAVGVEGIPTGGFSVSHLRAYALLSSTGRPKWTVGATDARELIRTSGVVYEFVFPKSDAPIGRTIRDLTFEALFGKWTIRTTFKPRTMLYHGRPAL
jgi:hypothetical protein